MKFDAYTYMYVQCTSRVILTALFDENSFQSGKENRIYSKGKRDFYFSSSSSSESSETYPISICSGEEQKEKKNFRMSTNCHSSFCGYSLGLWDDAVFLNIHKINCRCHVRAGEIEI